MSHIDELAIQNQQRAKARMEKTHLFGKYALCLGLARVTGSRPEDIARQKYARYLHIHNLNESIQKGSIDAGDTQTSGLGVADIDEQCACRIYGFG